MKRFHTFLDRLKIPGLTSVTAVVALGEQQSYLWWEDRIYSRPSHIGFDSTQEKFFTFSGLLGKKNTPIPPHLQKIRFIHEGKITHPQAASSYINLWLQQVAKKKKHTGVQVITGKYVVPCGVSEAHLQIYDEVFTQVQGSWSAVPSEVALREELSRSPLAATSGTIVNVERDRVEMLVLFEQSILSQRTLTSGLKTLMNEIDQKIREEYHVLVDEETLERLYGEVSRISALPSETRVSLRGKDLTTNLPTNVVVECSSLTGSITQWLESLVSEIRLMYSHVPPEILAQILPDIAVAGTGGNFKLAHTFLQENFHVSVQPWGQPELVVIKGAWHVA